MNIPAFPVGFKWGEDLKEYNGMTLRDYFAAKAMQSMNSRPDYEDAPEDAIALDAYALADAMMEARNAAQ